jgi:alpha-L-rhamnosidase
MARWAIVALVSACSSAALPPPPQVEQLRLVDFANPLGVDDEHPRLAWRLAASRVPGTTQSAYQIHVTSGEGADVWDSGIVSSTDLSATYDGPVLDVGNRYSWTVRVWDQYGTASQWAPAAWWEMSPRSDDDWRAMWISSPPPAGDYDRRAEDLLRREFSLSKPVVRARVYVAALGYYELWINGLHVGDYVLDPGWTDYSHRVLYSSYDVTALVHDGTNAVGLSLGAGWFGGLAPWGKQPSSWDGHRRARLRLVIDHGDGTSSVFTTVGGDPWRTTTGPTVTGEVTPDTESYDARLAIAGWNNVGFDDSTWLPAVAAAAVPTESQAIEPMTASMPIRATSITEPRTGSFVYDYGRNIAGWVRLRVSGAAGTTVTLRYGERLLADGTVDPGSRSQLDTYVLHGEGEEVWEPRYSYKGFQYVQVDGYPGTPGVDDVQARRIHTDLRATGEFTTSNALLETIHAAVVSSSLNNLVSVPTDGSMVEKLPWTGDAGLMSDSACANFDMQRLFSKWLVDIEHSQDASGNIGSWAPQPPGELRAPSAAWGDQYLQTAWNLYLYYGDAAPMRRHYESMKRYFAYEVGRLDSQGISHEAWGDYLAPFDDYFQPTVDFMGTVYVVHSAQLLAAMAKVLGEKSDEAAYASLTTQLRDSLNANYYDETRGFYASAPGRHFQQTPNLLALAFGLVPPGEEQRVVDNLVYDVEITHAGHLDTGVLGTKYILPILTEYGHTDLAYAVATADTFPSWGYWFANGATSLWEMWGTDSRSRGHWFRGTVDDWFYQELAGIRPLAPGFARIDIKPHVPVALEDAGATIQTVRGAVGSHWTQTSNGGFVLDVTVPSTAVALVHVPAKKASRVTIDGEPAGDAAGVTYKTWSAGYATYEVKPGTYRFEVAATH